MGGNSDDSLIEGLIAALEAAYDQMESFVEAGLLSRINGQYEPSASMIAALEAAQRPPVSPEVREALSALAKDVFYATRDEGGTMHQAADRLADALLARFSVPSQPVYDEEAIALWLASAFDDVNGEKHDSDESWMFWAEEAERTASALVAALRGGELTREEEKP